MSSKISALGDANATYVLALMCMSVVSNVRLNIEQANDMRMNEE